MDDKMSKKTIPIKNYIILGIICISTIALACYLASWYTWTQNYYKNNSVMTDILTEITEEEISNYVLDNPHAMIYISSGKDQNNKEFEKELKKLLIRTNITKQIVYLNIDKIKKLSFAKDFQNEYFIESIKQDEWKIPNLIIFEDGEAISYVKNHTNVYDIEALLRKYEVIDD